MFKRFYFAAIASLIFLASCERDSVVPADNSKIINKKEISGYSLVLGRPEDNSVTISAMFDNDTETLCEYGTDSLKYDFMTVMFDAKKDMPVEIGLTNLVPNTKYFYRIKYRQETTGSIFMVSPAYSFHTNRAEGETFTFTVESDEHLYDKKGVRSIYQICLNNQASDNPDFMLSLGDIFGNDHDPLTIAAGEIDYLHKQYRPLLGSICHSIPLFLCLGNHEGENDYYMSLTPPDNLAIRSTLARMLYYPNPRPDNFYSGNRESEAYGIGIPENYYSFTWGDALFVVLDAYRYENSTTAKPQGWDWTLGSAQYAWLKKILETSSAKYKFVFAHHIRGQGRGGITNAKLFEWGGYEENGLAYTFDSYRPGWGVPVQKLFVDNHVNIFFQGHDHLFAHETLDGVTYQEVPMPSDSTYQIGMLANSDAYTSDVVGGTGHLRVTVSPGGIKVDFVQAYLPVDEIGDRKNGKVAFSYTIN